jgi:hypothetical protein
MTMQSGNLASVSFSFFKNYNDIVTTNLLMIVGIKKHHFHKQKQSHLSVGLNP